LVEDNYNLIEQHDFFKELQVDGNNFVGWGGFVWGVGWVRELVLQLGKVLWFFIELGFNFLTSFGLVLEI
jgi:hypothetical protein